MNITFFAVCCQSKSYQGVRIGIAAAYRRAALMLRYCHPWLLDAPTLLARADGVIQ
jgi:hypothetical protein